MNRSKIAATAKVITTVVVVAMALGVALLLVVIPRLTGGASLAVRSGSMGATIPTGSLVVVKPVDPRSVRPGDIVTFQSRPGVASYTTHRVVEVVTDGGALSFVTKGDANRGPDVNPVPAGAVRGRVALHLPHLGRLADTVGTVPGLLSVAAAAGGVYLLVALARRARPVVGRPGVGTAAVLIVTALALQAGPRVAGAAWSDFRAVGAGAGAAKVPAECDAFGFVFGPGIKLGTAAGETLAGTSGADIIFGNGGDDVLLSGDDPSLLILTDLLHGGGNGDCLAGGDGADRVYGGQGANVLIGGPGADRLYDDRREEDVHLLEGSGEGRLYGGDGNDYLRAGMGTRLLHGGPGTDTCSVPVVVALLDILLPLLDLTSCENVVFESIVGLP